MKCSCMSLDLWSNLFKFNSLKQYLNTIVSRFLKIVLVKLSRHVFSRLLLCLVHNLLLKKQTGNLNKINPTALFCETLKITCFTWCIWSILMTLGTVIQIEFKKMFVNITDISNKSLIFLKVKLKHYILGQTCQTLSTPATNADSYKLKIYFVSFLFKIKVTVKKMSLKE